MHKQTFLTLSAAKTEQWLDSLDNQAKASAAGVIINSAVCIKEGKMTSCAASWSLPEKLNCIIRPLMNTLKVCIR